MMTKTMQLIVRSAQMNAKLLDNNSASSIRTERGGFGAAPDWTKPKRIPKSR